MLQKIIQIITLGILLQGTTDCTMVRKNNVQIGSFRLHTVDGKVAANILETKTVEHFHQCLQSCLLENMCQSFNIQNSNGELTCQLVDSRVTQSYEASAGWKNYGTENIENLYSLLSMQCESDSCTLGEICFDDATSAGSVKCIGGLNLVQGRPTTSSSIFKPHDNPAFAVDDNLDAERNFFHSAKDYYPWWSADLQSVAFVKSVTLYKRQHIGWTSMRFHDVGITVAFSPNWIMNPVCQNGINQTLIAIARYECHEVLTGRYLQIYQAATQFLELAEVQVTAVALGNI